MITAALLLAVLSAAGGLQAEEPGNSLDPAEKAAQALEEALGPEATRILSERRYLVFADDKKLTRLVHAQWPALKTLAIHAADWATLPQLRETARSGGEIPQSAPLGVLQKTPAFGLVTEDLKAALEYLEAARTNTTSLGTTWAPGSKLPLLYRTSWGKQFLSQSWADLLSDFRAIAPFYFEHFLSFPAGNEAEKHFSMYLESVYDKKISSALEASRAANAPSAELVGWIAKYLLDQSRLLNAFRIREGLDNLEKSGSLRKDLSELSLVAAKLAAAPDALARTQSALNARAPEEVRLSSEKLHVQGLAGSPLDLGDEADVSLAYWVDGLKVGEAVPVTEVGFLDHGEAGLSTLTRATVKRQNGGPYVFKTRLALSSNEPVTYRLVLSAPGAEDLRREILILPSKRLHELLLRAAQAENLAQTCLLDQAAGSFEEIAQELKSLAGKPQFAKLESWARKRAESAKGQAQTKKTLLGLLPGARLHATKEQCEFSSTRTQQALRELKTLPPGCARFAQARPDVSDPSLKPLALELYSLLEATDRRRLNQEAFSDAAVKARKLEEACKPSEAAETYAAALALLDSDPAARCGAAEKDYTDIRISALPRVRSARAFLEAIDTSQSEASRQMAAGDFSGALATLTSLLARVDSSPDSHCYKSQRHKAEELALVAGLSLAPPDKAKLKSFLPKDAPRETAAAVNAERKKLDQEEELRREGELERQMPPAKAPKTQKTEARDVH